MPYLIVAHYHETDTVSFHKSNVSKYYYILTYIITSTLPSRQNKRNLCYGPIQVTGVLRNFYCIFRAIFDLSNKIALLILLRMYALYVKQKFEKKAKN